MVLFNSQVVLSAGLGLARYWPSQTHVIPNTPQVGNATYITNNSQGPFDGPKADLINATNVEWWYFDAFAADGSEGIGVWFFTSNPPSMGLDDLTSTTWFLFQARFADAPGIDAFIPGDQAIIQTVGEGSSGLYSGTGSGWTGAPDLSSFALFFDSAEFGISGEIFVESTAPAHFPLSLASDPDAEEVYGSLGWAQAVPAGKSIAHVKVNDQLISFSGGTGYHDHNWAPGLTGLLNWYAIHADVGPFVWHAVNVLVDEDGTTSSSAWIYENNKTVLASLDSDSVTIRPWGNGAEYPPKGYYPNPEGAVVRFNGDDHEKYVFNVTFKTESPRAPLGKGLGKWFGVATGGREGEESYTGPMMFEWLDFVF